MIFKCLFQLKNIRYFCCLSAFSQSYSQFGPGVGKRTRTAVIPTIHRTNNIQNLFLYLFFL